MSDIRPIIWYIIPSRVWYPLLFLVYLYRVWYQILYLIYNVKYSGIPFLFLIYLYRVWYQILYLIYIVKYSGIPFLFLVYLYRVWYQIWLLVYIYSIYSSISLKSADFWYICVLATCNEPRSLESPVSADFQHFLKMRDILSITFSIFNNWPLKSHILLKSFKTRRNEIIL